MVEFSPATRETRVRFPANAVLGFCAALQVTTSVNALSLANVKHCLCVAALQLIQVTLLPTKNFVGEEFRDGF